MMHMIKQKSQYLRRLDEFYQELPTKSRNQLKRHIEKPLDTFYDMFLKPNLLLNPDGRSPLDVTGAPVTGSKGEEFGLEQIDAIADGTVPSDNRDRPSYVGLSDNIFEIGRNHAAAENAIKNAVFPRRKRTDPRDENTYFTNYLRISNPGQSDWKSPSSRVALGPYTYFTIEHDAPGDWDQGQCVAFLDEQFSWFRRKGNKSSAPIYRAIEWARQFADFRGVVACYSGHKSIHITFVFDTRRLMESRPELRDGIRPALINCFRRLSDAFSKAVPCDVKPDPQLALPEQYRRLPNGVHVVTRKKKGGIAKGHIFDLPHGVAFPQVTIFEELSTKAPNGARKYFIDELEIEQHIEAEKTSRNSGRSKLPGNTTLHPSWICAQERDYCFQNLADKTRDVTGDADYPKLTSLDFENQLIASFLADSGDTNPGVLMFENRSDLYAPGQRKPETWIDIGMSLGQWVLKWRQEWRLANPQLVPKGTVSLDDDMEVLLASAAQGGMSVSDARANLRLDLDQRLRDLQVTMVHAPEGIGKTTALMELISERVIELIDEELFALGEDATPSSRERILCRPSMMAFSNYDMAIEKCDEFNASPNIRNCIGVVMISFSEVYKKALTEENTANGTDQKVITRTQAAQGGFRSKLAAIQKQQPNVWKRIKKIHFDMLEPVRSAPARHHVVFFCVHDVLRQWADGGLSPAFFHKGFFNTPTGEHWKLSKDNRLRFAVHDEVSTDHIVTLELAPDVDWVLDLIKSDPAIWKDQHLKLDEAYQSWKSFNKKQVGEVSFDETLEIHRIGFGDTDCADVSAIGSYGLSNDGRSLGQPKDQRLWSMYRDVLGKSYYFKKHDWWMHTADTTILLTTESLPRTLFETQCDGTKGAEVYDGLHLSAPSSPVAVHRLNSVATNDNVTTLRSIREYIKQPEIHAVCNRAADSSNVTNYTKALGSNKFMGEDLLQLINHTSPDEYATLQIINKIYGMENAIQCQQVDLINQIIGRNLGFRETDGGLEHHLVVSYGLWDELWPTLMEHSRYSFTAVADAKKRRDILHNQNKSLMRKLAAGHEDEIRYYDEIRSMNNHGLDQTLDKLTEEAGYYDDPVLIDYDPSS